MFALQAARSIPQAPASEARQQQPTQTSASEVPLNDDPHQTAPPPPPGTYLLQQKVQLVMIPALVTDRAGNHIPGLKASDFVVKDNGKIRRIRTIEEITAPPA